MKGGGRGGEEGEVGVFSLSLPGGAAFPYARPFPTNILPNI